VRQKDRRKPAVLYAPETCNEDLVDTTMVQGISEMDNTKRMYQTAKLIRKRVSVFTDEKRVTDPIAVSSSNENIPIELYSLIRWILVGTEDELQTMMRSRTIDRSALTISQNIMYAFKTKRQVQHIPEKATDIFRLEHARENSQVRGLALTVHHDTRNKKLMELLHMQNYCVSYNRSMLLVTSIANVVVKTQDNSMDCMYHPS